jgi:hypothetical protein
MSEAESVDRNRMRCPKCRATFGYPVKHVLMIALSRKKWAELILGIRERLDRPAALEQWLAIEIAGADCEALRKWIDAADALLAKHLDGDALEEPEDGYAAQVERLARRNAELETENKNLRAKLCYAEYAQKGN